MKIKQDRYHNDTTCRTWKMNTMSTMGKSTNVTPKENRRDGVVRMGWYLLLRTEEFQPHYRIKRRRCMWNRMLINIKSKAVFITDVINFPTQPNMVIVIYLSGSNG